MSKPLLILLMVLSIILAIGSAICVLLFVDSTWVRMLCVFVALMSIDAAFIIWRRIVADKKKALKAELDKKAASKYENKGE